MFILRKINKENEYNVELGDSYIYVAKDNKQAFENVYSDCFGCAFGDSIEPSNILGFVVATNMKMDGINDQHYPIYKGENAYIMISDGKTFCKLY